MASVLFSPLTRRGLTLPNPVILSSMYYDPGILRAAMARSLLDLLDQVGTKEDALTPLRSLARKSPHSAKYLGLRSSQGELPAVKVAGDWQSSERALLAYLSLVGRG